MYKDYAEERLRIDKLDSRLTREESAVRFQIMNFIIDNGRPFNIHADADALAAGDPDRFRELFQILEDKKTMVVSTDGDVQFMYPVSAVPSKHKVTLADGRSFHAMCAIDGMGTAFTFGQDNVVESNCAECGEPVRVRVQNGEMFDADPDTTHVLHMDLNKMDDWAASG